MWQSIFVYQNGLFLFYFFSVSFSSITPSNSLEFSSNTTKERLGDSGIA